MPRVKNFQNVYTVGLLYTAAMELKYGRFCAHVRCTRVFCIFVKCSRMLPSASDHHQVKDNASLLIYTRFRARDSCQPFFRSICILLRGRWAIRFDSSTSSHSTHFSMCGPGLTLVASVWPSRGMCVPPTSPVFSSTEVPPGALVALGHTFHSCFRRLRRTRIRSACLRRKRKCFFY